MCRLARFYSGSVFHKGEWLSGTQTPIITTDLAERVAAIPKTGRIASHVDARPFLFTKLVRCFACGYVLAQTRKPIGGVYRGEQSRRNGDCQICKSRYVREDVLERHIWPILEELRQAKRTEIEAALETEQAQSSDHEKRRKVLLEKRRRVAITFNDQILSESEYYAENARIERELEALTPALIKETQQALAEPFGWSLRFGDSAMSVEEMRRFFARTLVAIFVDASDKKSPIRAIAPQPALRPMGVERLFVGYLPQDGGQEPKVSMGGPEMQDSSIRSPSR